MGIKIDMLNYFEGGLLMCLVGVIALNISNGNIIKDDEYALSLGSAALREQVINIDIMLISFIDIIIITFREGLNLCILSHTAYRQL